MRAYGTGTVFYDKNKKKYIARIIVGTTPNGTAKYKSKSGTNPKPLRAWLKAQQKAILLGEYEKQESKETIVNIATKINEDKRKLNIIGDSTFATNEEVIKVISKSALGKKPISEVTQEDLTDFYSSVTSYSASYISKLVRCIKQAYRYAIQNELLTKNITDFVPVPKSKKITKKVSALTTDQQKEFICAVQNAKEPYKTMLLLSLYTGMRIGEISALQRNDVNLKKKTISITKTVTRDGKGNVSIGSTPKTENGNRTLDITGSAYSLISKYVDQIPKKQKLLFTTNRGNGVINTCTINAEFKKYAPEGFSQHCLRHTFATRCIESGMPVKVLSKILGHSSIKITLDTYCDVFDKYEKEHINNTEVYLKKIGIAILD